MIKALHATVLTSYFSLMLLLVVWFGWLAPSHYFPVAFTLVIGLVPLLFPLRGLLHGKPYTYAWSSFLWPFYFAWALNEAWINVDERLYASLVVILSLILFIACIQYIKVCHQANPDNA